MKKVLLLAATLMALSSYSLQAAAHQGHTHASSDVAHPVAASTPAVEASAPAGQ